MVLKDCKLNLKLIETISSYDTQQNNSNMTEKDLAGQPTIQSVGSHLQVQDHEVNLQAIISNPLSIGEVATTLTESQKWFVLKRLHFDALVSLEELPPQASFIFEKIEQMTTEEAVEILRKAIERTCN